MNYLEEKDLLVDYVGHLELNATSDVFNGQILDTKIELQSGVLCWVAGNKRKEFIGRLKEVIEAYRI